MLKPKGSRQQTIKEKNRALVLQAVLNRNIVSRAEIARNLGLTKTTLTNLVSELIKEGILTESETFSPEGSGMGRKSIGLDLGKNAPVICGVLIQRGNLHIILSDLKGKILADSSFRYSGLIEPEMFRNKLAELYRQTSNQTQQSILAVGVSCVGPLNIVDGTLLNPHNFFTEPFEFPIVKYLESISGVPVWLCNDATAGAIAEKLFGKGREEANFIYISTFNGIGAGFYLDNQLYNGEFGQNGELGHMSINFMGPKCACGNNGCLELYANIPELVRKYSHFREYLPEHPLFQLESPTILDILTLIDTGDVLAMSILSDYCRYLAAAVANLITQLNVKLVILAGSPQTTNHFFEHTLAHMINEKSLMGKYQQNLVVKSDFGLDSPLYGSIGIILDKIFHGEIAPFPLSDFSE